MKKQISTTVTEIGYFSKDWIISHYDSSDDLIKIIKTKAYSNAIFADGKRSGKNIIGFHDLLILDIDNDDTDFTIENCKDLFTSNNIASLIVPSKSHRKEKNGVIKDRYRVLCHFDKVIPADIAKEVYQIMMKLIVKDLHMEKYVDNKALKDYARYYGASKNLDHKFIRETPGEKIILDKYIKEATLKYNQEGLIKKIGLMRKKAKLAEKRRKIDLIHKQSLSTSSRSHLSKSSSLPVSSNDLFVYDTIYKYDIVEIANNINFIDVISDFEIIIQEEHNNDGIKIRTADKNTYQFFENNNILCDLKKEEVSYNLYSYIKNHFRCNSIEVLQHMNKYTDIVAYKYINEDWQYAIVKSLDISTNRREFEGNLKTIMKFDKISVQKDNEEVIIISGKKYHIADFELEDYQCKSDIIKKFQENRKKSK